MQISSSQIKSLLKTYTKQDAEYAKNRVETKPKKSVEKDGTYISETARAFQVAKKAIKDIPEIREELLQGLQTQINTGTYEVSDDEIAEKMLARSLVDKLV